MCLLGHQASKPGEVQTARAATCLIGPAHFAAENTCQVYMHLRGGGKFSLKRMMKITLDRLPPEERARMFDKVHKAMPGLDQGNDKYTHELRRFRQRREAEEADARARAEVAAAATRENRDRHTAARLAAAKRLPAKLPPLTGDAGSVAHALEPYVQGGLGRVEVRPAGAFMQP